MDDKLYTGVCDWFATSGQSYGYIRYNLGQVYVHYKNIVEDKRGKIFKTLKPGDVVSFNVSDGHYVNGTQAVNVTVVKTREENRGKNIPSI